MQLTHMLEPKDVFEDYIYFSGMSETIVRWGQQLAERYSKELALKSTDLVGELASNDGVILKPFKAHARIQGVEPFLGHRPSVVTRTEFKSSGFTEAHLEGARFTGYRVMSTLVAGYQSIRDIFWPQTQNPATTTQGYINTSLTVLIMTAAVIVLIDSMRKWIGGRNRPELSSEAPTLAEA